jgi:hypothetical protein
MIVLGSWPQSEAMLSVSGSSWEGIGNGHGYLSARQVTVTVSTRSGGRPRSTRLWLPDAEQQFRPVSTYSGGANSGATYSGGTFSDGEDSLHEAAG